MKKVLLIGPVPEPTTGVSLANKVVIQNIEKSGKFKIDYINTAYQKFEENHGSFSLDKVVFFLKTNLEIPKIFQNDIIYITPGQTFFGVLKYLMFICISKISKKELVIHIHGNYLGKQYEMLSGLKRKVFSSILKLTNKGIVLSELLMNNMTPFIDEKDIYQLYNFVEDDIINSEKAPINVEDSNTLRIFYLSNLMKEKGIFDLLEALVVLEKQGIDFHAKIAGNIDKSSELKINTYLDKLKKVEFCGVVKGKAKQDLLNWGNIFILPTYYSMEGQPIAILEAMSTGNLVLTTKHAGIPDIFKAGENGFYVDKNSASSIVDKLKYVKNNLDEMKKISEHNKSYAKKKYTVKNFIDNIEVIFTA
ncbi:glycosyltransferase family 4 protein [Algibacter mikhailovii]|uniref:glycosyltransferase family 4 protein n=1 Tax=Algibacter mikhailovii TaxID=425498 RepID=UPI002495204F|nr:glycosyltransferase [Algibacter mikhailovii]